jgi:hypothetical protein
MKKSYLRVSHDLDKLVREKMTSQNPENARQSSRGEGAAFGSQMRQQPGRIGSGNSFTGTNEDLSNDTITLSDSFSSAQAHGSPVLNHSHSNNKYMSSASLDFSSCRQSHPEKTISPPAMSRIKPGNKPNIPPFRVPTIGVRSSSTSNMVKSDDQKDSASGIDGKDGHTQVAIQSLGDSFSTWVRSLDNWYVFLCVCVCVCVCVCSPRCCVCCGCACVYVYLYACWACVKCVCAYVVICMCMYMCSGRLCTGLTTYVRVCVYVCVCVCVCSAV